MSRMGERGGASASRGLPGPMIDLVAVKLCDMIRTILDLKLSVVLASC